MDNKTILQQLWESSNILEQNEFLEANQLDRGTSKEMKTRYEEWTNVSRESLAEASEILKQYRLKIDALNRNDGTAALAHELAVTKELLAEFEVIGRMIPECPVHGRRCLPHIREWIKVRLEPVAINSGT